MLLGPVQWKHPEDSGIGIVERVQRQLPSPTSSNRLSNSFPSKTRFVGGNHSGGQCSSLSGIPRSDGKLMLLIGEPSHIGVKAPLLESPSRLSSNSSAAARAQAMLLITACKSSSPGFGNGRVSASGVVSNILSPFVTSWGSSGSPPSVAC